MHIVIVYKATSRFTSARKYKLIKLLTFIWVLTFIEVSGCYTKLPLVTFYQRDNAFFQHTSAIAACRHELEGLSPANYCQIKRLSISTILLRGTVKADIFSYIQILTQTLTFCYCSCFANVCSFGSNVWPFFEFSLTFAHFYRAINSLVCWCSIEYQFINLFFLQNSRRGIC